MWNLQPFADILQCRYSKKFHKILWKTTVLESLFKFVFFKRTLRWLLLTKVNLKLIARQQAHSPDISQLVHYDFNEVGSPAEHKR